MNNGILVCGNIVVDFLVRPVDRMNWGTTTWVESLEQHLGGNGASTSFSAATLGAPVRLLSVIGGDPFGGLLLDQLRAAGVDVSAICRAEAPTPASIGIVNSQGDRLFLHRPGAGAEAFAEPLVFDGAREEGFAHFHLANPFALPRLRVHAGETMRRARAAGLTTSVDTGWDSKGRWMEDLGPCLPHTGVLFVNEDEAKRLGGDEDAVVAARRLREHGAEAVVLKLGGRGSMVLTAATETAIPAFPVKAIDTTGAGDCFAGAFLAARWHGLTLEESARTANAAAALSVQQLGATGGLQAWDETLAWMEKSR